MHTLLLRLAGPMQSWGTQSRFTERDTGLEPSKSGVVGLVCAALGRGRDEPVDDLASLRMAVRIDREGVVRRDYHTALDVVKADSSKPGTVVSNRYYLADADFLVALTGDDLALLEMIDAALDAPRWPLFLGRKSFVPGVPVRLPGGGVRAAVDLERALSAEVWRPRAADPERKRKPPSALRAVLECGPEGASTRRPDQPAPGAAFRHRRFLPRHVRFALWETGEGEGMIPIGEACHV